MTPPTHELVERIEVLEARTLVLCNLMAVDIREVDNMSCDTKGKDE